MNASIASNWLNYGERVDPKDVKAGDVAVRMQSRYGGTVVPGQTGSHVGFVYDRDEKGNFKMLGGNQGRPISGNQNMGGYEFRRPSPPAEQESAPPLAEDTPKSNPAPQAEIPPAEPVAAPVPVNRAPGPVSYNVDMKGLVKKIKETQTGASFVSDDYIKDQIKQGVPKGVKLEGNKITGSQADLNTINSGFKDRGIDTAPYLPPIEMEPTRPAPRPPVVNPQVERLRIERDKLKKDLIRVKKQTMEKEETTKDDSGNDVPPPKDNTRSDRALMNINPQLHQDEHPQ